MRQQRTKADNDTLRQVGNAVRLLRKANGFTLQDFSAIIKLTRANLVRLEQGKAEPGLVTLIRIADALGQKLWEVFQFSLTVSKRQAPKDNKACGHPGNTYARKCK